MYGLLLGFALGAMAFTDKGHEIGNQMWDVGTQAAKKAVNHVSAKPAEQSPGAIRDAGDPV